mgnify:CR=1 FL=1
MSAKTLLAALAAAAVLATATAGQEALPSSRYYQVTYTDGRAADLSEPPAGRAGISRVVEIARYEHPSGGYVAYSTGDTAVTVVDGGRTVRTQWVWDGGKWAPPAPPEPKGVVASQPTTQAAPSPATPEPAPAAPQAAEVVATESQIEVVEGPLGVGACGGGAMPWLVRLPIPHLGLNADVYVNVPQLAAPFGMYGPMLPPILVTPQPIVRKIDTDKE